MRTLIYARYSSHLQNSRSTADQIAICRERAEREGWEIVGVYNDDAISGAAGIGESERPQLHACLARLEAVDHPGGRVEQLLTESTDRLARHQGDAYTIRERLEYAGVRLFTLMDGVVDDITGTVKGLFDARFRKDLAARVKRGQRGAVAAGRAPAGLAYGYRKANRLDAAGKFIRGLREIEPEQAAIVARIFAEYAAGQSADAIAQRLNEEAVPGPRGGKWRSSTIAGDRQRQNGILQNRLYAGMLVHNRTSKVVDPRTRRTRIRPNPEAQWIFEPVPDLRIVDDTTWEAVQAMRSRFSLCRPERARRPRHMLSGLARCGTCGGGWVVVGNQRWACSRHRDGGGCSNNRVITTGRFEARVLGGLRERLLDPALVSAYVREYHHEYARRAGELGRDRARLERTHADASARMDRLVAAIAAGAGEFAEVREALAQARAERDRLAAEIEEMETLPVVAIHPTIADDYRRQVERLNEALAANPEARMEAIPIIRSLIDSIVVTPAATPKGVEIEVSGRLASIIALATGRPPPEEGMLVVERAKGIGRKHTILRAVV